MRLTFHGAAGVVTGSNYLLQTDRSRILIDCGQFQGEKELERLNRDPFPYEPASIDCLLLTHAHIDHSGRIPLLVKQGFRGRILCTRPTAELATLLLKDSGRIHEAEAEWENRKRERAGLQKEQPLFTEADAIEALAYLNPVDYDRPVDVAPGVSVTYRSAGHLLGAAFLELNVANGGPRRTLLFSGDLGMRQIPMLNPPVKPGGADYLVVESTYGDRLHENVATRVERLVDILLDTTGRGGTALIPSFAIGRTQEILFALSTGITDPLKREQLMQVPIYVDSPLAINAISVYEHNVPYYNSFAQAQFAQGKSPLRMPNLHIITTSDGSIALNKDNTPKVIISASGMCDAGRIQHHLKHHLWRPANSLIFVGYQAEGSLGRQIKDGFPTVQILGETVRVGARIHTLEGFSGHADREDLLSWLEALPAPPKRTFVVHGEPEMAQPFARHLEETLGHHPEIPQLGQTVELL